MNFLVSAAGLYYIAELVEEYTVIAKKVILVIVLFVTTIYLLFIFFDNIPWLMVFCGLATQALHALILTDFPYVNLKSIQFIGAVFLLIINHYLAFSYFTQHYFNFAEVISIRLVSFSPIHSMRSYLLENLYGYDIHKKNSIPVLYYLGIGFTPTKRNRKF